MNKFCRAIDIIVIERENECDKRITKIIVNKGVGKAICIFRTRRDKENLIRHTDIDRKRKKERKRKLRKGGISKTASQKLRKQERASEIE